jgi:hypothetical protein
VDGVGPVLGGSGQCTCGGQISLAEGSGLVSGMIGNLQYIVLCRLITHLEQSKAVEISDKQIVCWKDERRHKTCAPPLQRA